MIVMSRAARKRAKHNATMMMALRPFENWEAADCVRARSGREGFSVGESGCLTTSSDEMEEVESRSGTS